MDRMENDERLSKIFFRPPQPPSEAQTEAFVARFLDRLEEERPGSALSWWLGRPWLVPALGLALASMLAFIRVQSPLPAGLLDSDGVQLAMMSAPVGEVP
jgi:hypothetical protein